MKSVTEFWNVALQKGLKTKTELAAAGKTPEEIQQAVGEAHKYEGDKLKHFINAMEVATQNPEGLSRVLVVSLTEGESAPPKATKIEETYYIPEFTSAPRQVVLQKNDPKGGPRKGGGKGKGGGGPKESPWGLSPEQKAAKKGGGAKAGSKPS